MGTPLPAVARGMTLIELIVAVGILVLIIAAVGYVFSQTSGMVSGAQGSAERNAGLRVGLGVLRDDLESMTKDGFLILVKGVPNTDPGRRSHWLVPPMLMFTATGDFTSVFDSGVTSKSALIIYTPVRDKYAALTAEAGNPPPDVFCRFVYLLAGDQNIPENAPDEFPSPKALALREKESDPIFDDLTSQDFLNITLADLKAQTDNLLQANVGSDIWQRFVLPFASAYDPELENWNGLWTDDGEPLRLDTAPVTVGGANRLWPYLLGGCANMQDETNPAVFRLAMEFAFCDGYDRNTTAPVPVPEGAARVWLTPEGYYEDRYQHGWTFGLFTWQDAWPAPEDSYGDLVVWTFRNKAAWPKALKLTLNLTDPLGRIEPAPIEMVFDLPE